MFALDLTTILGNKTQPWFLMYPLKINRGTASDFFSVAPVVATRHYLILASLIGMAKRPAKLLLLLKPKP